MPDGGAPLLPPVQAEGRVLASVIGSDALLRLIEARGGTCIDLGQHAASGRNLGAKLGLQAGELQRLRKAFGKQRVKVPLLRPWRARIYRARGLSYGDIALKLGVTERAVHVYLRDAGLTRQLSLEI